MGAKLKTCNAKIRQLQGEKAAMKGSLSKHSESSHSVMGSSNIRVKVPDDAYSAKGSSRKASSHRRTGSNKFSYSSVQKGGEDSPEGDDSSSEDEMFKRNRSKARR